jgi:hypothetical protein
MGMLPIPIQHPYGEERKTCTQNMIIGLQFRLIKPEFSGVFNGSFPK